MQMKSLSVITFDAQEDSMRATHKLLLLAASARRIVIATFSDRRFFVWAKWGGVP